MGNNGVFFNFFVASRAFKPPYCMGAIVVPSDQISEDGARVGRQNSRRIILTIKIRFLTIFLISSFIIGHHAAQATVFEVPSQYSTIHSALSLAQRGDHVKLAPGHYFELNLVIPSGITLSGTGSRADLVTIDGWGQGRILLGEGLDITSTIENITFINGSSTGEASYDQSGGAILMNNSSARIINCRFINNFAEGHGGAIRFTHSSPQIINCYFENNRAQEGGGAIDCSYNSSPGLDNCFFRENEANWGGAVSCRGNASPIFTNCSFDSNRAAGGLGYGGAIMTDSEARPSFIKNTFYGNHARYGGALACFEDSQPYLESCTLVYNSSQMLGAGVVCSKSYPIIEKSIVAFQEGMAFGCVNSAEPQINCTNIYGNTHGDWTNAIAGQIDIEGNISADPLFCSPYPESFFQFYLRDESPCADEIGGCSLMGAWTASCDYTPTYINSFTAIWDDEVPHISWNIVSSMDDNEFILMRSRSSNPTDEYSIPFQIEGNGRFVCVDSELQPERDVDYLYRLYIAENDGSLTLVHSAQLAGLGLLQPLQILGAWPNPFNPKTTISFEIANEKLVNAAVHDISGRLVIRLAHQVFAAGEHELIWDGKNSQGLRVESGAYFVLVQADGLVRSQKVLLLK
jgi:predicted outer membrane repeat protein